MATKTTFVVFKQQEPQSVADLSGVVGDPLIAPKSTQTQKKTTFWGDFRLKTAPHRRFGGSGVAEIFIFLSNNKNCPLFVKKVLFYLSPPKSYRAHQKNYHILSCSISWHHSFSKLPSNFWGLTADQSERLSTPWEGPRPHKSPI